MFGDGTNNDGNTNAEKKSANLIFIKSAPEINIKISLLSASFKSTTV